MSPFRAFAWRPLLLSAALALVTMGVSMNFTSRREHRWETMALQEAILRAKPSSINGRWVYYPQFQNRVLFPLAQAATVRVTGLAPLRAYVALRLLSGWFAFWVLLQASERLSGSPRQATQTAVLAALALIVTFGHPWEHPTDVLDMAAFAVAVPWTIDRRYGLVFALAMVASANRESSVFLSLLWGAVHWIRTGMTRRLLGETIGLGLVAMATVMALRIGLGGVRAAVGPAMPLGQTLREVRAFLGHPSPDDWPMALFALFVLCAAAFWHQKVTRGQMAIIAAGLVMAGLSAIGGAAEELRIYIPAFTVVIVASVIRTEELENMKDMKG